MFIKGKKFFEKTAIALRMPLGQWICVEDLDSIVTAMKKRSNPEVVADIKCFCRDALSLSLLFHQRLPYFKAVEIGI